MKILLADDHAMVRQALKFYLETIESSISVIMAGSVSEALELLSKTPGFDLIVLDYKMPGMNGSTGFEHVAAKFPGVPIVILSGFIGCSDALRMIEAGAAGIIPKDLSTDAMIHALKLILSGEKYVPSILLEAMQDHRRAEQETSEGPLRNLTPRQREVVKLLTQGLPNKTIAKLLGIEEVTAKMHISKIFKKIGAANRTDVVRIAMSVERH